MATQLRDYRITDGELDRFIQEWRTNLAPLRRACGFTIAAAWTVEGESRFVWLLVHPDGWDAVQEADARYFASPRSEERRVGREAAAPWRAAGGTSEVRRL